jgi:glycosyltransferase involved in cell wall biosynthesis
MSELVMTPPPAPTSRPLKVLFLASYFPKPTNPAMGPWALTQAKALLRNGVDVRVVSLTSWVPAVAAITRGARRFASCPATYWWDGVPVDYLRWGFYQAGAAGRLVHRRPRWPLAVAWVTVRKRLLDLLATWKPDLVYAHHSCVNGAVALRLRKERGLPYVVTDHDFDEVADCDVFPERRSLMGRVVNDAFCAVSVAARMEADVRRLFPGARTATIPNGVDAPDPRTSQRPRPAALTGRIVVFSAGAFYERKGFPLLVEAFARVAPHFPDAVLRIAGDGPQRKQVESTIRAHGLGSRVQLTGLLPRSGVQQELAWCDMFALIGWNEPFATVLIEASAAGKPMIVASDGGFMDVFRPGVHGVAVTPRSADAAADALGSLLRDADARRRMGAAALRLWADRLSSDASARQYIALFREALTRSCP